MISGKSFYKFSQAFLQLLIVHLISWFIHNNSKKIHHEKTIYPPTIKVSTSQNKVRKKHFPLFVETC